MSERCLQEDCRNWDGDGCPCRVLDVDPDPVATPMTAADGDRGGAGALGEVLAAHAAFGVYGTCRCTWQAPIRPQEIGYGEQHRAHVAAALAVVLDAAVGAAVAAERERIKATIESLIEDAGPERPWVRADDLRAALRGLP